MTISELIKKGLIESGIPEIYHEDGIDSIMAVFEVEINQQLRSTGKVILIVEDDLKLTISGVIS